MPIYFARSPIVDCEVHAEVVAAIVAPRVASAGAFPLAVAAVLGTRVAVVAVAVEGALPKPSEIAPRHDDKQNSWSLCLYAILY